MLFGILNYFKSIKRSWDQKFETAELAKFMFMFCF